MPTDNPCLQCGACCACYRATFYWSEADDAPGGTVPVNMTVQISPFHRAMRGTDGTQPRCCALEGEIGKAVSCRIYPLRASACRDYAYSWHDGIHNPRCDSARARWHLPALQPQDVSRDPRAA